MKNIKLIVAIATFGSIMTFVACNKSQMIAGQGDKLDSKLQAPTDVSNLRLKYSSNVSNMLSFSSKEELDKFYNNATFLKQKKSESDYTPLRKTVKRLRSLKEVKSSSYLKDPAIADTLYSDYGKLLDVLNRQKLVSLLGYIVRVDLYNHTVYAISDTVRNATDIILNNVTNSNVLTFSTNDDVVSKLESGIIAQPLCSEPGASTKSQTAYVKCSKRVRTKKKVTYQKAGIYFSLLAKGKAQKRTLGIWWATSSPVPYITFVNFSWKPKCQTGYSWFGDPANYLVPNQYTIDGGKVKFRAYESSTGLTSFFLQAKIGGCSTTTLQISSD